MSAVSGAFTPTGPLDTPALRRGRLARLRRELAARDCAGCVILDPVNVRFATGARNMQVFHARNPARYLFVATDGPVILFEFEGCHHLAAGLETVDEVRPATTVSYVAAADRLDEKARAFAGEIAALATRHGGGSRRLAVERVNDAAARALAAHGLDLVDAQEPIERARACKSPEEIACIRASLAAVEAAVGRLRARIAPGITENALWAELHAAVIEAGGDYVETRLLSSGPRTNPWFQECADRVVEAGDLVALDTDVVGPYGYYADFSRTFLCGDGRATGAQRELYALALDQLRHDVDRLRPGLTFREYAQGAWPIPERFAPQRYFVLAHGVGMTGEYPYILHARDHDAHGYDGVIEPGMTLCVESYIGAPGAREGVKLEQQVLVTDTGTELLSRFPFEDALSERSL